MWLEYIGRVEYRISTWEGAGKREYDTGYFYGVHVLGASGGACPNPLRKFLNRCPDMDFGQPVDKYMCLYTHKQLLHLT